MDIETLLGCLAIIAASFIFAVAFNPYFWQGLRNSKYWDEQKKAKSDSRDLADPDSEEI